jgi:hypothetical protein
MTEKEKMKDPQKIFFCTKLSKIEYFHCDKFTMKNDELVNIFIQKTS